MQFIKPNYIQRLLKLKSPEDVQEWREERKANFPTRAKREASNELRRESNKKFNKFAGEGNQKQFAGEQRNTKFHNKNGKFGRGNHHNRFNNGRHPGNKRPFDQARNQQGASGDEPNRKEPKLNSTGDSNGLNEQENSKQNKSEQSSGGTDCPERSADPSGESTTEGQQMEPSTSRDNRTNNADQQNRFKRRRQPTLLEKVSALFVTSLDRLDKSLWRIDFQYIFVFEIY